MIKEIQAELERLSDKKNKEASENYLKGAKFRGLKMSRILEVYKRFKPKIKELLKDEIITLGAELLKSEYFEDKRVGIQILSDNSKILDKAFVESLFDYFDKYIYEWATCDVLSSKVITKILLKDDKVKGLMVKWSRSKKVWAKRASAIAFVNLAGKGGYEDVVIEICQNLVTDNFRFIQLAVGWCMRNLGQKNLKLELEFIKKNYKHFSREGLRYATEKMAPETKNKVLKNEL